MNLVAGIDLGGTETKIGLINREGEVVAFRAIPTNAGTGYETFFSNLKNEITALLEHTGSEYSLAGISIGAPTGSQKYGTIEDASNLNWPRNLPVRSILESMFNLPILISNDANAAAIGEMLFGVARDVKNFICITLGTGLGSGIVIEGKLLLGSKGHAGELGHTTAIENGRMCGCGRKGCLETYVSATGIVKTVTESYGVDFKNSDINAHINGSITAKKITAAAKKGDPIAVKAFEYTGEILGKKLADAVAILNPELIVLTGGLSRAGDLILEPTKKYLNDNLLNIYRGTVDVKLSKISTKKSAILGAAAIMWLKLDKMSEEIV